MFGQVSFVFLYKKLSMELGVESEYIYVYKLMNKMSIKYYIYYKYVVVTEKKQKKWLIQTLEHHSSIGISAIKKIFYF